MRVWPLQLRPRTFQPSHPTGYASSECCFSVLFCLVAQLCLTLCDPTDVAHQAPLSVRFPRQEYWSGLPFPSPGYLPKPGIKPESPVGRFLTTEPHGKPGNLLYLDEVCCSFALIALN